MVVEHAQRLLPAAFGHRLDMYTPNSYTPSFLHCLGACVGQFVAIQVVGLNQGLVAGVAFSTVIFVISYASERRCGGQQQGVTRDCMLPFVASFLFFYAAEACRLKNLTIRTGSR